MHGIGNDYVYVSTFDQPAPADPSRLAVAISDRHFGVGSDGLILRARSGSFPDPMDRAGSEPRPSGPGSNLARPWIAWSPGAA